MPSLNEALASVRFSFSTRLSLIVVSFFESGCETIGSDDSIHNMRLFSLFILRA